MNLWENEKELIALKQKIEELEKDCLTVDEKKLVIGLLHDTNYLRYINDAELNLLAKLKDEVVWQRGEK
jgi:hypothetical protein